jgi:hypothetical protein|tara:strand:- start:188 stop:541 length:354 start_codon:yes stop_codon:yes gene_type:complete
MGVTLLKDMELKPCNGCSAKVGANHMAGCGNERCPKCSGQLISCGCFVTSDDEWDDEEFVKYTPIPNKGVIMYALHQIAEENNLWCYWSKTDGWVECDIDHPKASHDLNRATIYQQR